MLEDDKHWDNTLEEAALCNSPYKLLELFTVMLMFCQLSDPLTLWEKYKETLSEDIRRQMEKHLQGNAEHIMEEVFNKCLVLIEDALFTLGGQGLLEYGLPQPKRDKEDALTNREYLKETNYDITLLAKVVSNNENTLTDEQLSVYRQVIESVKTDAGQIFFLDAPGGTGKTLILNLLLAKVRSEKGIALAVASFGIASTLLEGGKTAHSAFKLQFNMMDMEKSICNISKQSNMAQVLRDGKLIV